MELLKQIEDLDKKISSLRSDLIQIIGQINRMVNTNNAKTRVSEYNGLKQKYYETNQQVEQLNGEKKELEAKLQSLRQQAA